MKRLFKIAKSLAAIILLIALIFAAFAGIYMQQAKFGKAPSGNRLALIKQSPNYRDGKFQNISVTPTFSEGHSFWGEIFKKFTAKKVSRYPTALIPTVKTDLRNLPKDMNVMVWFGHSSYFIQIDGKRILVDPVISQNVSPVPGTITSFKGTDIYSAADFPEIDYLLISHDHYDHLDYETVVALKDKIKKVICGLGVGSHFEYWGYPTEKIIEKDWHEKIAFDDGLVIYTEPARHKSGRSVFANNTLWMSYLVQTPTMKIYYGGDGGYDTHFKEIGNKYGAIDLAILENGQYDIAWHYVHTLPNEVLQAAQDLHAKRLFPLHSSRFVLANHAWNEPLQELIELNKNYHIPLITPLIGEAVNLNDTNHEFKQWWVGMD